MKMPIYMMNISEKFERNEMEKNSRYEIEERRSVEVSFST